MPAQVGLNNLAAMNAGDMYGHRYETSPEGMLTVMPPLDSEHAVIVTRLTTWLAMAGWAAEQIMQAAGVRIPGDGGDGGDGGRIPDLTVWSQPQPPTARVRRRRHPAVLGGRPDGIYTYRDRFLEEPCAKLREGSPPPRPSG